MHCKPGVLLIAYGVRPPARLQTDPVLTGAWKCLVELTAHVSRGVTSCSSARPPL